MVLQGQDAWRAHPVFKNLWRQAFPGFRLGVTAFAVVVVAQGAYNLISPPKPQFHGHIAGSEQWARSGPGALPGSGADDDDDE